MTKKASPPKTAEAYTIEDTGDLRRVVGDVVKAGEKYADVKWRESGCTERVRYSERTVIWK